MKPRYERKYYLSERTAHILRERVRAVLLPDIHAGEGGASAGCNIYFDDFNNSFLTDKEHGAFVRDKYRLRWYNDNLSFIRLERKHKKGFLSEKTSALVSAEQFEMLRAGRISEVALCGGAKQDQNGVWDTFANIHRLRVLRPVVTFAYLREAYTHPSADVRITFDSQIAGADSGLCGVLELKYTAFLPSFISELFSGLSLTHTENSKYAMVRAVK